MLAPDIKSSLGLVAVGAARALPIAWSIPAFGGPSLPGLIRLAMGIGLSLFCLPILAGNPPVGGAVLWIVLVARETMVGVVMGLVCACMFRAAEAAGQFTDVLRGANMAEVFSPGSGERSSPLGTLMVLLSVVVFFGIGGPGQAISALVRSYEAIPIGVPMQFTGAPHVMAVVAIAASAKLIESAIGLCAPVIVSLLLADIVLGIVGRAVPGIPLYFVGMPLKALLGVGALLLGLAGVEVALESAFGGFLDLLGLASRLGR